MSNTHAAVFQRYTEIRQTFGALKSILKHYGIEVPGRKARTIMEWVALGSKEN